MHLLFSQKRQNELAAESAKRNTNTTTNTGNSGFGGSSGAGGEDGVIMDHGGMQDAANGKS